jgi:hypothetical protein
LKFISSPYSKACHAHIAQELRVMQRRQMLDGLDLNDDASAHHEIQPLFTQQFTAVRHWIGSLTIEASSGCAKLERNGSRVDRLEQARTERPVYRDAASDRAPHQRVDFSR